MKKKKLGKIIVILGPTSSGKTDLSIKLAQKFNGEVVSADSRQVYKNMDIGTGKITKEEMEGIPHHLLDIVSPKKRFSVAEYQRLAIEKIKKILKKKKIPFLVGGSPFYIYSVVEGWQFPKLKPDQKLREKLEKKSTGELFEILINIDKERAKNIDGSNKRRLIRSIEIAKKMGKVPLLKKNYLFDCLLLGIRKTKEELGLLIEKRILRRLEGGMLEEIKNLHQKEGVKWERLDEFGLEYRWLSRYLQKKITYPDMVKFLLSDTKKFSKRQMTWFKKDKRINWLKNEKEARKLIVDFLD